jgi:hypothetical protein
VSDAQSTISHISEAISILISNVIPPRAYTFLFALVPGVFFETSVLLTNPALVYTLLARAQPFIGPSRYATLALALFLAFVIGNAFMYFVAFVQVLGYLYRFRAFVWEEFCSLVLAPLITRLQGKPWWSTRRRLSSFAGYVQNVRMWSIGVPQDEGTRKCWARFATQLLKTRYGIEARHLDQEEWNVLYATLGLLTTEDTHGNILMLASEATGWCGLAAMRLAPALWNRYYVSFSIFLIVIGLLHDWHVERNLNNPRFLGVLRVRALLKQYRNSTERRDLRSLPRSSAPNADLESVPEADEIQS